MGDDDKRPAYLDARLIGGGLALLGLGVGGGSFGVSAAPDPALAGLVAQVEALEGKVAGLEAQIAASQSEVRCLICETHEIPCPGCR